MTTSQSIDHNDWKRRFFVPRFGLSQVAKANPARGLVSASLDNAMQLYAWDVSTGGLRRVADGPGGKLTGTIAPDGEFIYYHQDQQGNELGHIVRVPFAGGAVQDLTPTLPPYSLSLRHGFDISRAGNRVALALSTQAGFALYTIDIKEQHHGEPRLIYQHQRPAWAVHLSADGGLAVLQSTERTGRLQFSLIVFEVNEGQRVGELWDGEQASIEAICWSPLSGDARVLASSTRSGFARPLIWNVLTDERTELVLDQLEGEVTPLDWSPDGSTILLAHAQRAVQQLYRYDLASHELTKLEHPSGSFGVTGGMLGQPAYFAPDGRIIADWHDSTHPEQVIALDAQTGEQISTLLAAQEVPPGQPVRSITFRSSDGEEIQGWLSVPPGPGPFPTLLYLHGGPHMVLTNRYNAVSQVWNEHGFAWLEINYRGSTTFGQRFQQQVWGDMGHWELEDMLAAQRWLVDQGIAAANQVFVAGDSYGGFLSLLALGKRPESWAGAMVLVALADWSTAYADASPSLQGFFRALFGGTPEEKPELMREASPLTYADQVEAPIMAVQGKNDTRVPPRAMELYEARLKELGKQIEVYWFDAGHLRLEIELVILFLERALAFAQQILGALNKQEQSPAAN